MVRFCSPTSRPLNSQTNRSGSVSPRTAMTLSSFKSTNNPVEIPSKLRDIKAKLGSLHNQIPEGVQLANWYDQSELILASNGSARDAVLIGVGLAALILLLFLRNWKITLFAAIAVPSVLCATVLLLYVLKMSFNIMTLGGLAAAVGLIIDDTIVMAEHIIRRVREKKTEAPKGAVLDAAAEFTRPLIGSSA